MEPSAEAFHYQTPTAATRLPTSFKTKSARKTTTKIPPANQSAETNSRVADKRTTIPTKLLYR
ncbi:hypothetical protein RRSWK_06658 [Rhodopirellula sp. SWK7]|nr:hypothetical protein RRSWK_06658 [Rhodopirellula sp. SWK7]